MSQKICPRCGAAYSTLKSETCPQCFAKLAVLDDDTAMQLAAARSKIEQSPEYQEAKANEDEQFRHQSFQACMLAVAIAIVTAVAVCMMIGTVLHRHGLSAGTRPTVEAAAAPIQRPAEAQVQDAMPARIGSFRREKMDQTPLSGTLVLMYHAAYLPDGKDVAGSADEMDAYAMDRNCPAAQQARLRDAAQMAADRGVEPGTVIEVASGSPFLYEVVGPGGSSGSADTQAFTKALALAVVGH